MPGKNLCAFAVYSTETDEQLIKGSKYYNSEFIQSLSPDSSNVFTEEYKSVVSKKYRYSISGESLSGFLKIHRCKVTVMRVAKENINSENPKIADNDPNISLRMTDISYREKYRAPIIVTIKKGTTEHFHIGVEESRNISFQAGTEYGTSHSLGAIYTASIEAALNKSKESSYGENISTTRSLTLNDKFCNKWQVTYYLVRRLAYMSAPAFGDSKEVPFTFTESVDIESIPLCSN